MRLALMHIDDVPYEYAEEAALIIPGGERAALMVPLQALEDVVPMLLEALEDLPPQCCDGCGELLAHLPPMDLSGL